jgi:PAS domain S-box-containing protein/diguanylate cyclase (GGDEF)-like protein
MAESQGGSPREDPADAVYRALQPGAIAAIVEESREGIAIADLSDPGLPLCYVNRAFETITGYPREEAIGRNCRFLQGTDREQPQIERMRRAIAERAPVAVTLRNYRKDGRLFWNALHLFLVFDAAGHATHYVGLLRDVTEARRTAEQLDRAEHLDLLTGILNRYSFVQRLDARFAGSPALPLVVKIDVARFNDINGGYGHDTADALLQQIAQRLEGLGANVVARTGGNEFAIACALDRREDADRWLQRIDAAVSQRYALPGAEIDARFATGFTIGAPGADAVTLIRQAGTALHHSKNTTLREVHEFDREDEARARDRLRMTSELRHAAAKGEFLFHYQPKLDLRSGALAGAEALLRWESSAFGMQSPECFIGLAEETGLILDIGHWGRREVARFAAEVNRGRATPLRFSVNVSSVELTHRDLVASVAEALKGSGADPSWLTLELTETLMAEHSPELLAIFSKLRDLGVGLSVDDFGTGYSSLRYLERFPLSEIKIDRHFINGIADSAAKRIIVGAVVELGRELRLDVVAEGVETEAEKEALRAMHCPFGQGFLLGRPVDADGFRTAYAAYAATGGA